MKQQPFSQIKNWTYVDADTGEARFWAVTRQFFEWDKHAAFGPQYNIVREVIEGHGTYHRPTHSDENDGGQAYRCGPSD